MVKKALFSFGYFLVFMLAFVLFTPKQSVYYFMETQLQPLGVVISNETLQDNLFVLNIENATVYGQNIELATAKRAKVLILGMYNSIEVNNIQLSSFVDSFFPKNIDHIALRYSIINPLSVNIFAEGEFGIVNGELSLADQNVSLVLKPSKKMLSNYKTTLQEFKKHSNGEYTYAKAL